ncbi:aldehyde dehydrogenase [Sphingomonas jatrophae]|uniref:aldehyde dehydrogenase (NAD(+)) n=1 Tax=Sphingomonas jatrophae TaxID=1166337 RepID=A0A1I6KF13_9SPHN|nr:aldehyde dehydrogenase [Sphingomonas jatrophae]SFR89832.1 betaine-aldehyde dehydrogenase [Sphingomonas jatrophae]
MASAPDTITLAHPDRFFIGGDWVEASSAARFDITRPHDEAIVARVAEAAEADADRAVAAARAAFDTGPWPRLSPAERAGYLHRIAMGLSERGEQLAHIWTNQMGILHRHAQVSAAAAGGFFHYYGALAESFPFVERHQPIDGVGVGLLAREAVGVVLAIVPWNAPLMLAALKVAPALLAGCTVVLKASPEAPLDAYVLAEVAEAAGLPPGVLNVVTADRAVSERMVRDARVDKVSFTGSSAAGRKIASICGERIARCTLELGGKSAAIVLDDYDAGALAETLAQSTAMMSGQVCAALTRIVVPRARHGEIAEALAGAFGRLKVGDPYDDGSHLGPLAMGRQYDRVRDYVAKGRAEGATVICGGDRPAGLDRGFYMAPTVLGNVTNDMVVAREEIFGPVVSLIPADSEDHAVAIANDSDFGLNGAVFTDDVDRAYRVARAMRTGTVGHNAFRTDFMIGFGGFKQSGLGREGGRDGLLPYLESKTILLAGEPAVLQS